MNYRMKLAAVTVATLALVAMGTTQIMEVIKIVGVGAAVKQFGPDINKQFNSLTKHKDTNSNFTKVVPILTIGLRGTEGAIGAAQVKGTKANVQKVQAVASPEAKIFGEIGIRALIPVSSTDVTNISKLKTVDGVGVSGIVDLKL